MIRLLLLPTGHAKTFQRLRLRASASCYGYFTLPMGRSLSFGSTPCDSIALFRLAFASAPQLNCLALPQRSNSPVHYAKGTPSTRSASGHKSSTACRCMVSGSFNSAYCGSFHLSVTLLFTIGCRGILSLGGWAPRLHTEFHGIRATLGLLSTEGIGCRVRDCHPVSSAFPDHSACRAFVTPRGPATPKSKLSGLGSSAFARRYLRSLG